MPGPGRSTAKLQAQPDETWSQLQKRMINMVYDYTELFSEEVANFIELKSTASHTCMGYTVVSLLAVTAFLISIGATIETTPGMRIKPNLYTVIVGPPSSGKSQALKIAAICPLQPLQGADEDDESFLLEKVSPSGLSTFLAKQKKCLILSTEVADIFNNLLKCDDSARFSVSTLCQLFSGEKVTLDFATQQRRTIPENTPFAILGGIQMKPTVFLAHTLASQGSGLLDRMMICVPKCLPPSMAQAIEATQRLSGKDFPTDFSVCMEKIFTAHPLPTADQPIVVYTFHPLALTYLKDIHGDFNSALCEAIQEGRPTTASKHIELVQRIAVAIHVLNKTLTAIVTNVPVVFDYIISLDTVTKATTYVRHWEAQKEAIVKVIEDITIPCLDKPTKQPTMKDVEAAIMCLPGPVSTHRTFKKYYPRLRCVTELEYQHAVSDLTTSEFGRMVLLKVPRSSRPTETYLKPTPSKDTYNILEMLEVNVTPAQFEARFKTPCPSSISKNMKAILVATHNVPKEHFLEGEPGAADDRD